jgi:hypothetical protein
MMVTIAQLRKAHVEAHVEGLCSCVLWYVPTPAYIAQRWRARAREKRRRLKGVA